MLKRLAQMELPLWLAIIILALLGAGFFVFLRIGQSGGLPGLVFPKDKIGLNFQYGPQPALAKADYFNEVRRRLIDSHTNFVEADLSSMNLAVYEDGKIVKQAKILTKGREGSWWETPAGIYKIESREPNHFSSFGHVYQPWSMAFQGNFFIHGWPYHPGGEPVASTYSGGCIRLSTEDAKAVFDLVKVGTPVLVFEKDFASDNFVYKIDPPDVSARQYLAADLQNNFVFLERDSQTVAPIASITKLFTALVAAEYINLDKEVTITKNMIVATSKPRLYEGETLSAIDLLYPLLEESSNEAAVALASLIGQEKFIGLMNKKVEALGMNNTKLTDPAGSESGNVSNAEDLFNLAKYLYNNRSFVLKISANKVGDNAYGAPPFRDLENFNLFSTNPEFVGGKIGKSSAAKETMLAIFEVEVKGKKRPIAIIVLGSDDRVGEDVSKILAWIEQGYEGK